MGSVSNDKIRELKRNFVLQLAIQRGPFWKLIQDIRSKLGITPVAQLPPPDLLDRLNLRDFDPFDPRATEGEDLEVLSTFDSSDPNHLLMLLWETHSRFIQIIPEECRDERVLGWTWLSFVLACVFYDPPDAQLLPFASYADPPLDPAPIRQLPDAPAEIQSAERRFWTRILGETVQDPKWQGPKGIRQYRHVLKTKPDIRTEYIAKLNQVRYRYYIEVNEDTTEAEILRAFRMIRAEQGKQHKKHLGGRPPRDRLTALQCAILYDRHNERDPQDPRRKKWTYEKLAEKFGLPTAEYPSAKSARAHVQEGRKLLQDKP